MAARLASAGSLNILRNSLVVSPSLHRYSTRNWWYFRQYISLWATVWFQTSSLRGQLAGSALFTKKRKSLRPIFPIRIWNKLYARIRGRPVYFWSDGWSHVGCIRCRCLTCFLLFQRVSNFCIAKFNVETIRRMRAGLVDRDRESVHPSTVSESIFSKIYRYISNRWLIQTRNTYLLS